MTRLDDDLIRQLATQQNPRAYSHEVRYMAQEIFEFREAAKKAVAASQVAATSAPQSPPTQGPWGGFYPP